MNAVIYARYFSDSQREESIEGQLRECREYAEFYSAELSEKIHRGQKENALKGKNNGGGVPLGYLLDKKTQKLVIDPVTAPLVVEIFEKYADGKTIRPIVEDFNAREQMTAWFEQFRHGDPANREFQKRLIDTFVNAVYVFDDKLVLTYNYQHGTQTISLDEIESALSSDFDGATPPKTKILLIFFLLPSFSFHLCPTQSQTRTRCPSPRRYDRVLPHRHPNC